MTREEAIETVRRCCPRISDSECDFETAMMVLIPELAESEDERILASIADCVGLMGEDGNVFSNHNVTKACVLAWLEKQKEQKPVDYAEELQKCKKNPLYFYDKYVKIKLKPAEWSEYVAWLKSLRPQPKIEWTDKDEKVIEAACALLCEYAGYYKEKDMEAKNLQLFKVSQRLKSLRPQYHGDVTMTEAYKMGLEAGKASSWKPSEEQMEAFRGYIEDFQARAEAAVGGWNNFDVMIRLYENLKKLM